MNGQNNVGKVLVIGAGVSGLTTALCLKEKGFEVTVVADNFAPQVTSVVAGALWEWPPAVCGYHPDERSLERSKEWCITSYNIFSKLSEKQDTGVFMRDAVFYFEKPVEDCPRELRKMQELEANVPNFVHSADLIEENGVNSQIAKDAYTHLAPMIDTDVYMRWLLKEVSLAGCDVRQMKISGCLVDEEERLKREFDVDIIVNCTGLGARELANDNMYPLRGALIRVKNDGRTMPRITKAHCVSYDESKAAQNMIFIVPRGKDMLLIGGLAEPDEWDKAISLDNYPPIRDMLKRCINFLPILKDAEIDSIESVRVGLRPLRREKQDVRLEQERQRDTCIIHNYGHGGSGVTLSWGCAMEVVEIAKKLLAMDSLLALKLPSAFAPTI